MYIAFDHKSRSSGGAAYEGLYVTPPELRDGENGFYKPRAHLALRNDYADSEKRPNAISAALSGGEYAFGIAKYLCGSGEDGRCAYQIRVI
jgi:hypothetical protein